MTTSPLFLLATAAPGAATAVDTLARASEVPELASMALLSVVLAGISVFVRRSGPKPEPSDRQDTPRDPTQAG